MWQVVSAITVLRSTCRRAGLCVGIVTEADASSAATSTRACLHGAGPPRLVLVREPDQLGLERAHPQLPFGARLVELAEPHRHVAADDDGTSARLDDDHLHAARV